MAIKGWRKVTAQGWINKNSDTQVVVDKRENKFVVNIISHESNRDFSFDTKKEADNFAKKYMRKHPNG